MEYNDQDKELTADYIESIKEQSYREGWEEGFNYCLSLMHKPINLPSSEVKDKISGTEAFLRNLKW